MATTISDGTTTSTPDVFTELRTTSAAGTVLHPIIGSTDVDVTLRPSSRRSGTLRLFYVTEAAATTAETMHRAGNPLTLTSTERPWMNMGYVVSGPVELANADPKGKHWTLDVTYQATS
jgi:hypothetical protein